MFTIKSVSGGFRKGKLQTRSGVLDTPLFMPIATKGAVKHIGPEEIQAIGYELILGNTYHLWLRPGDESIKEAGGLHAFMNWNKPILTDSGGFQVFSLGERARKKFGISGVKLTEKNVEFTDPLNGSCHALSPERSIEIQFNLGSDIIMCLDECPPYPCSHNAARMSLELTTRWAQRCYDRFQILTKRSTNKTQSQKPLLFGIIQGSIYEDLRRQSTKEITGINFDGFAIGGVAVGEPREKLHEILKWVIPLLPKDKPRYLMGLGKPEEIAAAVSAGIDMFDCVIPTREGRHGRLFVWNEKFRDSSCENIVQSGKSFYSTINIMNEKFRDDFFPIDRKCTCYACTHYSKAYIRHLLSINEPFGQRLASLHNLTFYYDLMKKLRTE